MLQYFKSSNHFSFPVIVTNEVSEMEFDEDAPNNSRVHPRNLYSQPSANPEDINRIWKVNDKFYYHIVKLNSLGSLDYKELQGVATYLGLPGNLKRKQLMALIVARKKGKENVVDAILNEVNRERAGKKVKLMQQIPIVPIDSTRSSHVRHLHYNNATLLRSLPTSAFKRAKMNQLKKSKASMQGTRERQLNAVPSTSNLYRPQQSLEHFSLPITRAPEQMLNTSNLQRSQQMHEHFPLPLTGASESIASTSRYMHERNTQNSTVVNPCQPCITHTVITNAPLPNSVMMFDNPTSFPAWPSAEYSHSNMWPESMYHLETLQYNYANMPTSIYLGTSSTCTVTYIFTKFSEVQEVRYIYTDSVMTNIEQQSQYNYQQAHSADQLQYPEKQVQLKVLQEQHEEHPTQPMQQNMDTTEHTDSCVQQYDNSTHMTTPFDALCNIATSIIENTEENSATVTSGMTNNAHTRTSDLVTLSNAAVFSVEHKSDIALDFDNILDYILGEGSEMNTSLAAGTANSSPSTAVSKQAEPIDYSTKGRGYYHPLLIYDKSIMHFTWYNTNTIVSYPLQYTTLGYQSSCFVYNTICTMPGTGTEVCFSRPLQGIAHTYETHTEYTPKACVYMDTNNTNTSHQTTPNNTIPDCCLLQPEYSLSYDIPKLYLRSFYIRSEYLETNYSSNQLIPNIGYNESEKNSYHSSQVYYNIMLPNENNNCMHPKLATSNANYVELKSRMKNKQCSVQRKSNMMDFEASIQPLSIDEEMLIYNSLDDIENIDLSISETYHQIMASQHKTQCMNNQITCPFFYTQCNWLETVPLMAFHIRRMHREKIVHKNKAEYVINLLQLEALGDRGVKIIQDYNNHMFFVSLCMRKLTIYVTLQEVCESVDQHAEKSKGKLIVKLQNGIKYWSGEAHSMYYPLAKLFTPESSLEMPISFFLGQPSKHFRLYVELEI